MIDWTADHVGFVLVAYAIVAALLAAIVVATLRRAGTLKKSLAAMKLSDPGQSEKT
jgi:ABC-type thiamin/hydroxymethylpyrimidine transport system permease subunit